MHGGADKDALSGILAEDVVLYGPLGDEPLTGREAVLEAMRTVGTVAADLTYKEVLSGETHHAAYFRLQIEDTVVDGMDYILLDADGKIAEVTIWWRPLPSGVQMQGHLAGLLGMQPWELLTTRSNGEARSRRGNSSAPDGVAVADTSRVGTFRPEPGHTPTSPTQAADPQGTNKTKRKIETAGREHTHEQHQHHRLREHGPRHRRAGGSWRQHRRGHRPRQSKAADLATALGGGATTGDWGAAPAGDIVIVALLFAGVVPVVAQYGDALAGKVIVDISNPFNADADGLALPDDTSIAQEVAKAAPASASVVKAFNTVFGHVLEKGGTLDVFIAGDDAQAKASVSEFIASLGLRPLDVGGLTMAHWLEGTGLVLMGLARHGVGNLDFALGATEFPAELHRALSQAVNESGGVHPRNG